MSLETALIVATIAIMAVFLEAVVKVWHVVQELISDRDGSRGRTLARKLYYHLIKGGVYLVLSSIFICTLFEESERWFF